MADEPESRMLHLLREIRAEVREGFTKVFDDLAELREHTKPIPQLAKDVSELQVAVAAIRTDQGHTLELLEKISETQANHGARLNAIDGRLALIEKHTIPNLGMTVPPITGSAGAMQPQTSRTGHAATGVSDEEKSRPREKS